MNANPIVRSRGQVHRFPAFQRHTPFTRLLGASHRRHTLQRPPQRILCQSSKTFYELLEVPKESDSRTIKKAFKKMALRYHPDVNKEPDAKDKFMACKTAYQTLIDEKQRRHITALGKTADEKHRLLQGGDGGIDWDSVGDAFRRSAGAAQRRPKQKEEDFYGFGDFFRDLEKSASSGFAQIQNLFRDLEKDFQARQAKATDQPKSLWQEVYDIGEEFVEFLEQEIGVKQKKGAKPEAHDERKAEAKERVSPEEQARKLEQEAEDKKRQAEQEIEDMMAELRNKMKLKDKD